MSTPLDLNPTSGGTSAIQSAPSDEAGNDIVDLDGATTMLEETQIVTEDATDQEEGEEDMQVDNDDIKNEEEENKEDEADEEVEVEILQDEDEDDEDMMAMLPEKVKCRVEKLIELNATRDAIMVEYLAERAVLENKYSALCEPLYTKRLEVIQGKMDSLIETEKKGAINSELLAPPQDVPVEEDEDEDENIVGVPQFWVCAMGHMETVAELVTERDVDCLEHLYNVTCEDFPNGKGFTLKFYFATNDYFITPILSKTYEIPNLLLDDEPILKNVTGCTIQWKDPNKTLTHTLVSKKQRAKKGKHAGQIRTVTRHERCDSFFHFFNPPRMPSLEDMDEDEADAIEEAFDHDYDVAQAFRSHLIPSGVLWFTGEALDEDLQAITDELENNNVSTEGEEV